MKNLNYCFSAPAMLRLQPTTWARENPEPWLRVRGAIAAGLDYVRAQSSQITGEDVKISLLFNAFTEHLAGKFILENEGYGFDTLYADSGGLQMVTTNRTITEELKAQVYEVQKMADYGFCFDVIPLGIKEGVDPETARHRSQTGSKLFRQADFDDCIVKTALNVRAQTEAFVGTKTKAFYILQGNSADEMYRWFAKGAEHLEEHHFAQLQGLAPADTCIGNGELESVEMIAAAQRIRRDFGVDKIGNQIHFLGVGSPSRLLPAIFLGQGGYLDKDAYVSFDSSTASMSLIMGNMTMPNGQRLRRGTRETVTFMMAFYDVMHDLVAEFTGGMPRDVYQEHVTKHHKSIAELVSSVGAGYDLFMRAAVTLMPLWQVCGFFQQAMDRVNDPEVQYSGIGLLRQVATEDDLAAWKREFSKYLKSSRIDRVRSNTLVF